MIQARSKLLILQTLPKFATLTLPLSTGREGKSQ